MATIRHPITEAVIDVPDSSLPHLRMAGWELYSEYQEGLAARAAREAAAADAAAADAAAANKAAGAAAKQDAAGGAGKKE